MQLKTRTWALISLLCFIAAGYFWHLGNEFNLRHAPSTNAPAGSNGALRLPPVTATVAPATPVRDAAARRQSPEERLLAYRLTNTTQSLPELMRSDYGLLLRNALIDTRSAVTPMIPADLRASGEAGGYVVQARGAIDQTFLTQLQQAAAQVVSYLPNNAYLVRVDAAGAERLKRLSRVQAVLPWEPYYKFDLSLLPLVVDGAATGMGLELGVVVYPGEQEKGAAALRELGAEVFGTERSPFGHQLNIRATTGKLPEIARLPEVHNIELRRYRRTANDLARLRVGVVTNTVNGSNHLGLTGAGVRVAVNDTGIEEMHPDLIGRVIGATTDPIGHGTHVGGTLGGSGYQSASVVPAPPGSSPGANYRGVAPAVEMFAQPLDLITGPVSDEALQEIASTTNVFISNNSWSYINSSGYDGHAASYDAAVRDARPGIQGAQPMIFVFAAGNSGAGADNGLGGLPGTVDSPATAKNVIAVGALEQLRRITNTISVNGITNQPFFGSTDNSNQVAGYSARGNVGIGLEGPSGRFKPDLVAPGSFLISCRSSTWEDPTASATVIPTLIPNQILQPGQTNLYSVFVPNDGFQLRIRTVPNRQSPRPFPDLPIFVQAVTPPTPPGGFVGLRDVTVDVTPGVWFYAISNVNLSPIRFDIETYLFLTNNAEELFAELKVLNDAVGPYYRYESGTSQSAPVVSGMLALMQELFEQRLGRTNSPALMKAMLINGARSLGNPYDFEVQGLINFQGWGRPVLTNTLPSSLTSGPGSEGTWPVLLFDQDPTNALSTGESQTRVITLSPTARLYPLRVSLVWTDPPGNPGASLKLVNDLDLIVSNNIPSPFGDPGEVYYGNNITPGSDFNTGSDPLDTNAPPTDLVNNVENVFINGPLSTSYTITVRARRVNVNAVAEHTNNIAQDYALVVSIGNSEVLGAFTSVTPVRTSLPTPGYDPSTFIRYLSNGVPAFQERVGANSPFLPLTTTPSVQPSFGATNQWNFFVFTNLNSALSNVALVTFRPPALSRPRWNDNADIDLYVSTDPGLTNLDETVIDLCARDIGFGYRSSRRRGGTELVVIPNATEPAYYIGVKSEDQQSAIFSIVALASDQPFGGRDANGNIQLQFIPLPADIPDGSPEDPKGTNLIAIVAEPETTIRRLIVTNTISHEKGGDLFGELQHSESGTSVTLNNHRSFEGTVTWVYDDSEEAEDPTQVLPPGWILQPPDGPGTLRSFAGEEAFGVWTLTMIDNAPYHTGRVDNVFGVIEPNTDTNGTSELTLTVQPFSWRFRACDVPAGVTNFIAWVRYQCPATCGPSCPLDVYIRRGDFPTINRYDKFGQVDAPGGQVSVGLGDNPPIRAGRYYVGVSNPNPCAITFTTGCDLEYGLTPREDASYTYTNVPGPIIDYAFTNFIITVTNSRPIARVEPSVRLDHPRMSDLALYLVSPQGTRTLLYENRGSPIATNLGYGVNALTNGVTYVQFTDRLRRGELIKFAVPPYGIRTPGNLRVFFNGFENSASTNYDWRMGMPTRFCQVPGEPNNIWTVLTNAVGVRRLVPHSGTNVLALSNGRVSHPLPVVEDNDYILSFWHRKVSSSPTNSFAVSVPLTANIWSNIMTYATNACLTNPSPITLGISATEPVAVPKLRLCPGQEVLFRNVTNLFPIANSQGQTNVSLSGQRGGYNGLPEDSLVGCWSRSPHVLDSNTVASCPFFIGVTSTIRAPTLPGDYYLFLGFNRRIFIQAQTGLNALTTNFWQQCQTAIGEYVIGGAVNGVRREVTNSFVSEFFWQNERLAFTANPYSQSLIFQTQVNTTILLDSVELLRPVRSAIYVPEEPMTPFVGEIAQGDWKLEVWDTRQGPNVPQVPTFFSWTLDFIFGDSALVIALTNRITYTNIVRGDEIRYFSVDVPREVTNVVNLVTGPDVELLYGADGLPTGDSPPDPLLPLLSMVPFNVGLGTPVNAPIRPGNRYYLGVRNLNPAVTNPFGIRMEFNIPVSNLVDRVPIDAVITGNPAIHAMWTNSVAAVTNMNFYQFAVPYPGTNLHAARFDLLSDRAPMPGEVQMVLRRALPVVDHFPHATFFDYQSTLCHPEPDIILHLTNSVPVWLQPGVYYLGVYSLTSAPVSYTIVGTLYTNGSAPDVPFQIGDIPDCVDVSYQVFSAMNPNASTLTNFSRFLVSSNYLVSRVAFEITRLAGDADLFIKRNDLPSPDLHEFSVAKPGTLSEVMCLTTNIFLPSADATNWFMAIVPRNRAPVVSGVLRATSNRNAVCVQCPVAATAPAILPPVFFAGRGPLIMWSSVEGVRYVVEWSPDLETWTGLSLETATETQTSYFDDEALTRGSTGFYRIREVQ